MNVTVDLIELVANRFNLQKSAIQANDDLFDTLKINSLQALDLLTELEQHFSIELPDYELQQVRSFQDLSDKISQRLPG
jgi:acyl carrier protein